MAKKRKPQLPSPPPAVHSAISAAARPPSGSRRAWEWVLLAALFSWMFLTCCFPLADTDFWWHLRTGELILERGVVPQLDWYTFTDIERPWIDLHWGFQLLITAIYRLGGPSLVVLAKAFVITLALGVGWFATGRKLPVWLHAACWLLPIVAISGRGFERPEMLTLLFLAVWLYVIGQIEQKPRLIWLLPFVQLIWTNCHALFVLGLVVGGCYVVDLVAREIADGRWGLAPPADQPGSRHLLWAGLLVALACFINPYFEEGALFPLVLYRKFSSEQAFYSVNIGEFQQPIAFVMRAFAKDHGLKDLANIYLLAELGVWCLTAISFVWLAICGRWSVYRALLFAGFSHLAWEATRNTNIFALVSGVVLCANCADAIRLRDLAPRPRWGLRLTQGMAVVLVGLNISVVTGVWGRLNGEHPFGLGEAQHWFAHGASKFAGQPGMPERAFVANNGQAAVYIYHNAPERLVFMDGRLEVATRQTFEMYLKILELMKYGDPRWQELFRDRHGLPVVILDSRSSRDQIQGMYNTPGWRLVYADSAAAVFLDTATADKLHLPPADFQPLMYPPPVFGYAAARPGRGRPAAKADPTKKAP